MLEMAEEVTYADLKFITLEKNKNEEFQQSKNKGLVSDVAAAASVDKLIVTLLWFEAMQASQRVSSQNENLTLQKEMLENLLTKLDVLQAQNLNLSETVQQLSNHRGNQEWNLGSSYLNQPSPIILTGLVYYAAELVDLGYGRTTVPSLLTCKFNIPDAGSSNYPICVSIQGGNLIASDCLGYRFCICEKMANPAKPGHK
ncbi:hypothetical protein JD844_010063 [Phrynosoma platyrhinos]|uniref:Uncharacterized protein n=1 Tax=Phrynosoma platyrhinos TaxID=52577 RepID=A0ABQ7TGA3_PHRPL|nr:hypothetical protein JD844_010063 [Phrynosoma platyrhinos]